MVGSAVRSSVSSECISLGFAVPEHVPPIISSSESARVRVRTRNVCPSGDKIIFLPPSRRLVDRTDAHALNSCRSRPGEVETARIGCIQGRTFITPGNPVNSREVSRSRPIAALQTARAFPIAVCQCPFFFLFFFAADRKVAQDIN